MQPGRSGPLLDHLARLNRARAESALVPLGLRPRHLIALTVLRDHGGMTQQALAAALQVDRTNLVGLLNELEDDGLIARTRSTEDRRRHLVALTDAGRTASARPRPRSPRSRTRCSARSTTSSASRSTTSCSGHRRPRRRLRRRRGRPRLLARQDVEEAGEALLEIVAPQADEAVHADGAVRVTPASRRRRRW